MFRLYLVTDRTATRGRPLVEVVAAAIRGGVDAVQLREKDLDGRELCELGWALRAVCDAGGAKLLINDRIDVAVACGADGVHLPTTSFTPAEARALLGRGKIIACSTHSIAEARQASNAGANFVVAGPVFDTPSKRPYGDPLGLDGFAEIASAVPIPVVGIGGITEDTATSVRDRGGTGVAVITAILGTADPEAAARALRSGVPLTQSL